MPPVPSSLVALANVSIFLCCLYVLYLIIKVLAPVLQKRGEKTGNGLSQETKLALLSQELDTVKGSVSPLTQLVGDVRVLLDAIEDLRDRVGRLEGRNKRT